MPPHLSLSLLLILLVSFRILAFDIGWFTDFRGLSSGHTTCNFLTLPLSSNVLARGLASSPGAMDATDLPLFSANSALSNRNKFAIHHLQWLMGLRKEYAGALFTIQDMGTFGVYSQVFSPGQIENARDIDEKPSNPSLVELAIGTTYARSFLNKKLNIGVSLAYVESRLDHESGRALSGSVDLLFTPAHQFSSRLYLANFGTGVSYGTTSEPLPLQGGISLRFFPLPAYIPFTSKFNFDIGAGIRKIADEPVVAGISTGIKAGQYFHFFTGYEYSYGMEATISGLGIGCGFHHHIYGFEAAWKNLSPELGSVWSATVKIQLEEKKQRTAEDYYTIAEKFYRTKRSKSCRRFAIKALQLDPNMWKAHALLNRMKSEDLRNKKQEVALIYTGNLKNQFLPPPNPGSIGGIARQATAINSLRNQFPVAFTIQAGNIITAAANPLRTKLAALYLKHVKFDAVSVGNGEFAFGVKKLKESGFPDNLINSNSKDTAPVIPYTILKNGEYKVYVASFTNSNLIPHVKPVSLKSFEPENLFNSQAASCDLRILIMHDSWQNIAAHAQYLQKFEIIICGNLDQHFTVPMKVGKTIVLSAGDAGKYLGNLILRFDGNKKLVRMENSLISLSPEIIADSTINANTEIISAKIDLQEKGAPDQEVKRESTDSIFPFVSNREGKTGIYLKLIGRNAEFPLTRQLDRCTKPVISIPAGKIAFIETNENECNRLQIIDLAGTKLRLLADSSSHIEAAFTPDGKWIYYTAAHCEEQTPNIYRTSCEGGPFHQVIPWKQSAEHSINFSFNNEYMLFCSDRDGTDQIYLTNLTGEHPLKITAAPANHFKPTFSPNDQYIGYLSDRSNFGGKLDLWVYDRISSTHNQITQNSNVKTFCWLSDSKSIVYSSGANLLDLTKVDITAHRYSKVNNPNSNIKTYSDKNPMVINIGGEETIVYEREFENGEKQIFGVKPDGTGERCIIDSKGMDWLGF